MTKNTTPHTKELEWLAKLEFGRLNHELGKKPPLSKVTSGVAGHFKKIDEALIATDTQKGNEPECQKGCAMCCHTMVFANLGEIATAYMHIMKTFSKEEVSKLKDHLSKSADGILNAYSEGKPTTITCPLLKNDLCSIYEARPSQCRSAHSLNSMKCQEAFESPTNSDEIIPINPARSEISRLMLSALASSLNEKKLDHELYEFSTTLLSIMESPAILQKWINSKNKTKVE